MEAPRRTVLRPMGGLRFLTIVKVIKGQTNGLKRKGTPDSGIVPSRNLDGLQIRVSKVEDNQKCLLTVTFENNKQIRTKCVKFKR